MAVIYYAAMISHRGLIRIFPKALSALAHKIGRCIYFMLKNQQVFDEERFLNG